MGATGGPGPEAGARGPRRRFNDAGPAQVRSQGARRPVGAGLAQDWARALSSSVGMGVRGQGIQQPTASIQEPTASIQEPKVTLSRKLQISVVLKNLLFLHNFKMNLVNGQFLRFWRFGKAMQ